MVKREEAFSEALTRKRTTLEDRRRRREAVLQALYESEPKLSSIDMALASEGAKIAITALSGDTQALDEIRRHIDELAAEKGEIIKKAHIPEIEYDCSLCLDSGYINGKVCICVKELAKAITFERLSQEMPLGDCRFESFSLDYYSDETAGDVNPRKKMTAILKLCRDFADNFSPYSSENLLFLGDAGLGKTHLTLAMVSKIIEKGFDVIYGSAHNLLAAAEKEHFASNGTESYEAMIGCDLLVIDDLGAEFTSPYTLSVLYNLINSRLLSKRPTIINTNLSLTEIEKRYTPRIASRLIGNYTARKFFGKDIRQLKAMQKLNLS